ncbi:hypothetical protein GW916_01685 [bacterium]|nr:hypothetical protein [bacterium]
MKNISQLNHLNSSELKQKPNGRTLRSSKTPTLTPLSLHTSMKSINGTIEGSGLASNYYGSYKKNKSINSNNNKKEKKNKTQNAKHNSTQNNQQLTKRGLGVWAVLALGCGACAYDPADSGDSNIRTQHITVMEVSDELVISQNMAHIEKLVLHEGAIIKTEGHDVTLRIKHLVSKEGVIDTTPRPKTAPHGEPAKSEGVLRIIAENAQGSLHIISRGQNGAKGRDGSKGATGAKGARGQNAETGQRCDHWLSLDSPLALLRPDPEPRCRWETYCKRHAGNGGQGHRGQAGGAGEDGAAGGNTAAALIDVASPQNFRVTYEEIVGLGGLGGVGGDGGEGGPGGDAGHGNRVCGHAANGPQGPKGHQGPRGARGAEGSHRPICLRLGNTEIGNCREFDELTRRGAP